MTQQAGKMTQALQTALQMEIDGKEFYQKSGQKSTHALAKTLFQGLAEQEDVHCQVIKQIYEEVKAKKGWPAKETVPKQATSIKMVFREALKGMKKDVKAAASSELEAVGTAMKMEDKSYSYYKARSEEAGSPAEKAFYDALTAQEREHYLTLVDTHDYLSDPAGYFTKTERWGLDGA